MGNGGNYIPPPGSFGIKIEKGPEKQGLVLACRHCQGTDLFLIIAEGKAMVCCKLCKILLVTANEIFDATGKRMDMNTSECEFCKKGIPHPEEFGDHTH